MSQLLFKLNQVPDDESEDIRQLLHSNDINFYETDCGQWGLGFAAIWVNDAVTLEEGKALIHDYQIERSKACRENLASEKQAGQQISKLAAFMQRPIRSSVLLLFAILLAYFTVIPFFK